MLNKFTQQYLFLRDGAYTDDDVVDENPFSLVSGCLAEEEN